MRQGTESETAQVKEEDMLGQVWYLGGSTLVVDMEQYYDAVTLKKQTHSE